MVKRVEVINPEDFPGGAMAGGALTDAELRASDVKVTLDGEIPHVIIDSMPAGGSGLTDLELRLTPVPVSGTFFPVTQPVSAAALPLPLGAATSALQLPNSHDVTIDNAVGAAAVNVQDGGNSLTVDGTFWQVTQPVSGPLTDAQLRAAVVPIGDGGGSLTVDGTFWQAAQPITDNAGSLTVDGTVAVSAVTSITNVVHVDDNAGSLTIDGTVTVTPPTLTKGTQGATGFSTQDLKDAGRNVTNYFHAAGIAATNAEVMQSLSGYKGGAAVAANVSPAVVTTGKTYRITSISISYQSLATAGAAAVRLRANLGGAGVVGSPLVCTWTVGSTAAVAGITTTEVVPIPDGMEFAAGTGIAVGVLGLSTVGAALAAGFVTVQINGYEY